MRGKRGGACNSLVAEAEIPQFCKGCENLDFKYVDEGFYYEYGSESGIEGGLTKVPFCKYSIDFCPEDVLECPKLEGQEVNVKCLKCTRLITDCEPWIEPEEVEDCLCDSGGQAEATRKAS